MIHLEWSSDEAIPSGSTRLVTNVWWDRHAAGYLGSGRLRRLRRRFSRSGVQRGGINDTSGNDEWRSGCLNRFRRQQHCNGVQQRRLVNRCSDHVQRFRC